MKVDDPDDRQEMPEECDCCGYPTELKRFYSYGPGHQVKWLCRFCAVVGGSGGLNGTLANMFNELLKALQEK